MTSEKSTQLLRQTNFSHQELDDDIADRIKRFQYASALQLIKKYFYGKIDIKTKPKQHSKHQRGSGTSSVYARSYPPRSQFKLQKSFRDDRTPYQVHLVTCKTQKVQNSEEEINQKIAQLKYISELSSENPLSKGIES